MLQRIMRLMPATGLLALGLALVPLTAEADDLNYFEVAWTDIGIYPRAAPSMASTKVGSALPNGATVAVECELEGESVDNGWTSTAIWERLSDGTYLPNAFTFTGVDGWTPGVPSCEAHSDESSESGESPKSYSGLRIVNDRVSLQLINHYYDATGQDAVVDWSYFEQSPRLIQALKNLSHPDGYEVYLSNPRDDGDIYYGLGAFTIARTSEHCYAIKDEYDFNPKKRANIPYIFNWVDAKTGRAAEFTTHASGCVY